ncbi:HET-domain-containing protein, partial [Lophiostoma macrostomum CBS 122681]
MRLIHTSTLQLKEWITEIPHYVILSHTWGPEEVTFDDFSLPHARSMIGYDKIRRCCEQAVRDGFEWAWVDTCCIDKRSSAELSEAINSMWKWYWNASICYAWLSDVPANARSDPGLLLQSFQNSKWFTRGWCLQELLAPAVVEFYDETWTILGTKSSLLSIISTVTWIDEVALSQRQKIRKASVAQRLSWAATRLTSRAEDRAYCLLGLLDLNMPLLYGEGKRAFYRLQLELLKTFEDQTLFAWELPNASIEDMGLLAPSPLAFQFSGNIRAGQEAWPGSSVTNRGLVIQLPCLP